MREHRSEGFYLREGRPGRVPSTHDLCVNSASISWNLEHIESKIVALAVKAGYHD